VAKDAQKGKIDSPRKSHWQTEWDLTLFPGDDEEVRFVADVDDEARTTISYRSIWAESEY
jgi:hypothetical protein